ncbi:MAG: low molecular weight protein-tyrosine-phosphatase [Oscillospiraceae bacterium]
MYKILFVCHGNICRSPMAEFIFNNEISKRGITGVAAASAATSSEEIGNPVHRGTVKILKRLGIDCSHKRARRVTPQDYSGFDMIICMERFNLRNIMQPLGISADTGHKLHLLLDFSEHPRDVADPWYTGDFETTYKDVCEGCEGLIRHLAENGIIS